MRTRALLAALLMLVGFAGALSAQMPQTPPPLTEKIEVGVVNVDVAVKDSSGRPVTALTREDFEVFEDGKLQTISGFYTIENGGVRIAREAGVDALVDSSEAEQFRRKVVLLIDNTSLNKPQRNAAIEFVERFIDEQFEGDYEWTVATVGSKVQILQPFTDQKPEIRAALSQVREGPTFEFQREVDRQLLSDPLRAKLRENEFDSGYDFSTTARFQSREQTMRNLHASLNFARAIIQTCRAYSASEGKKLLLLVTGGMELNTSFGAFDSDEDRNMREMKREIAEILQAIVREANAANFSIYIVNARGHQEATPQHDVVNRSSGTHGNLKNAFQAAAFGKSPDLSDVSSSSLTLALGTGGRYLPNNRLRESLKQIEEETSNFYSLGYSPAHPEEGRYHRIKVRVKRPDVRVQHREGYVHRTSEQRIEETLRAPMTFPKERGSLPVTLELGIPDASESSRRTLPITATMPAGKITMFLQGDMYVGRVHVYLSVYDDKGNNVGYHHQVRDLRVASKELEMGKMGEFRYTLKIALKRGSYTIGVMLRDDVSNETGSVFRDIQI